MNYTEIIKRIEESKDLPVVNREINEIMVMLNDSESLNIEELAEKISKCGNLKETLLVNINSGYFKLARRVESLSDAIIYLGMMTVEKLIIAYLIKSLFPDNLGKPTKLSRDKYWKHCLGTSIAANILAEKLGKQDNYRYFAYGLIHDIGVMVIDVCLPDVIDEVVKMQYKGIHQIVAERLIMQGYTHTHAGALLCEKWNLPNDVKAIIEHHHTPLMADGYLEDVIIMNVADSISTLYYERLLCMNTNYVFDKKAMEVLGISMQDIESISEVLPQKVDEVSKQLGWQPLENCNPLPQFGHMLLSSNSLSQK
ncbi:HDOD domain-containing protein [Fonticella tunisiensis]|uniref:Putative nucleotidyltransferase with HDIG domain n=1 Tax=Fonticella tunisiensis TaxID=1096341 RepID=A0A4R7KUB3_9CLOT|nr:HDOD domain-containing protein [Fonticella tunisiensis]TDT62840.1 putative nucleotidyltransferase with HDIG domain [Fonticella tunisiensis]